MTKNQYYILRNLLVKVYIPNPPNERCSHWFNPDWTDEQVLEEFYKYKEYNRKHSEYSEQAEQANKKIESILHEAEFMDKDELKTLFSDLKLKAKGL